MKRIKDERIRFCVESMNYIQNNNKFILDFFAKIPNEVYNAINKYKNCKHYYGDTLYEVQFLCDNEKKRYDKIVITKKQGKTFEIIEIPFAFLSSEALIEGSAGHKIIKYKMFTKRLLKKPALNVKYSVSFECAGDDALFFISDRRDNIPFCYSKRVFNFCKTNFEYLQKTKEEYLKQDTLIYDKNNGIEK